MTMVPVSPSATLTFTSDWTAWLPSGDSIASYAWSISPDEGSMLTNDTTSVVTVTGFVVGKEYVLTDSITTAGPPALTADRSFILVCRDDL